MDSLALRFCSVLVALLMVVDDQSLEVIGTT
jgi:hypothetical protein